MAKQYRAVKSGDSYSVMLVDVDPQGSVMIVDTGDEILSQGTMRDLNSTLRQMLRGITMPVLNIEDIG